MRKLLFAAVSIFSFASAWAQHGSSASNMVLLGHDDLQGRSAYQPVIRENHGRWIAYVGHHGGAALNPLTGAVENSGTSLIDVTDPRKPRYLAHIPGEKGQAESGGAQMVRVCNGAELPAVRARSTCCATSATRRTRCGTSPPLRSRCASQSSSTS